MITDKLNRRQREILTEMQAKFVKAYLEDPRRDPASAAIAAGYSPKSARALGFGLLRKPHVMRACERQESGAVSIESDKGPMSREEAVEVLNVIARSGAASQRLAALRMLGEMEGWKMPAQQQLGPLGLSILAADEARARANIAKGDSPVSAGRSYDSPADAGLEDDLD